eukprot:GHVR01126793.1.p1 GENE.GHVR01126793.1~~GHVR01126793.1.p1  ORF type:complete len:311 (-),score=50.50 GHVR01126793.1:1383-2315(-)
MTMPTLKQNEALNVKAVGRLEKVAAKNILQNYQVALADIRKGMGVLYEKYAKKGVLTYAEMTKYNRLKSMHDNIIEQMGPIFSRNGKVIETLAADAYQASYYRNGWAITQDVGADVNWGLLNPEAVKAAVQNPISGLTLNGLTLEQRRRTLLGINRAVTQGLVQGESYPDMVKRVKGFLEGDAKRAMTVVRTEGQRAMVEGQVAAGERAGELGIKTRKIWDATLDGRTRPEHGEIDGQVANEKGYFSTAVGPVFAPLTSGDPAFDINCRCRVTYEVVGYEGDQTGYKTYDEWVQTQPKLKDKYDKRKKIA